MRNAPENNTDLYGANTKNYIPVSVRIVVDELNKAISIDPDAMHTLIDDCRVATTDLMADETQMVCNGEPGATVIGPLGLINMVLKVTTGYIVQAVFSDDSSVWRLVRFVPVSIQEMAEARKKTQQEIKKESQTPTPDPA